jgi:hypothetical protein
MAKIYMHVSKFVLIISFVVKMRQLLLFRQSLRSVRFSSYSVSSGATVSHDWPNPPVPAENVDITIAGGGLVGSATALAFGKNLFYSIIFFYRILLAVSPIFKNHKIVLLESQSKLPKVSKNQPYSNRVCALNSQSINLFQALGAWDLMKSIRVQKVARMQVEFSFFYR